MFQSIHGRDVLLCRDRRVLADAEAQKIICKACVAASGTRLQQWDRKERNAALRRLKQNNLSIRQIERLTGINRGAIQKA